MATPHTITTLAEACAWLDENPGGMVTVSKDGTPPQDISTQAEAVAYFAS